MMTSSVVIVGTFVLGSLLGVLFKAFHAGRE